MEEKEVDSIFCLAGIKVLNTWEIMNRYWPRTDNYMDMVLKYPWWLVKTEFGLIQIGWRKRVISIDWSDTNLRQVVTKDEVTKSENGVHAWRVEKAVEYLKSFKYKASMESS